MLRIDSIVIQIELIVKNRLDLKADSIVIKVDSICTTFDSIVSRIDSVEKTDSIVCHVPQATGPHLLGMRSNAVKAYLASCQYSRGLLFFALVCVYFTLNCSLGS